MLSSDEFINLIIVWFNVFRLFLIHLHKCICVKYNISKIRIKFFDLRVVNRKTKQNYLFYDYVSVYTIYGTMVKYIIYG